MTLKTMVKRRRCFRWSDVGVITGLFLWSACQRTEPPKADDAELPMIAVEILRVQNEEIVERRTLSGDIVPWEVVPLSFKLAGQVTEMNVDDGQRVTKGDLLAIVDARDYRLMRDLAGAQVNALTPHLNRAKALTAEEVLATATLEELQGKMDVARIQQRQAGSQLADTRLVSPLDGVVIRRLAAVGNLTAPGHPVLVVAQMDRVRAIFPVSQKDLPVFEKQQELVVSAPGISVRFAGQVHAVGLTADEKTRTFPVTVEVPNPELRLKAGMIVETEVELYRHIGIFVPLDTLTRDLEGRPAVFCVTPQSPVVRYCPVTPGRVVRGRVEVTSGLSTGDQIIYRGMVVPGDVVRVITVHDGRSGDTAP